MVCIRLSLISVKRPCSILHMGYRQTSVILLLTQVLFFDGNNGLLVAVVIGWPGCALCCHHIECSAVFVSAAGVLKSDLQISGPQINFVLQVSLVYNNTLSSLK